MGRAAVGVVVLGATAAAVLAPTAQAFRKPNGAERRGITRAWDKEHKKTLKRLFMQEIRISSKDARYGAVLYDLRIPGYKVGAGNTTVEYFKRTRAVHGSPDRPTARAAGAVDNFESLGQGASPAERDDMDPMYRITYASIGNEKITREITFGCGDGRHVTVKSVGTYSWSDSWNNVPLSRDDFRQNAPMGYFSGTETYKQGCPSAPACAGSKTISWHSGGVTTAQKLVGFTNGFFNSGYLVLTPGRTSSENCFEEPGADPMASVEVRLPVHWFSPLDDQKTDVDGSDFPSIEKQGRLGDCQTIDKVNNSCTETLDAFQGKVRIERVRRG